MGHPTEKAMKNEGLLYIVVQHKIEFVIRKSYTYVPS